MKAVIISDLHYGHNRVSSNTMAAELFMFAQKQLKALIAADVLFISGDITHKLLSIGSIDAKVLMEVLSWLDTFCSKRDIKIRWLEGTESHDMHQGKALSYLFSKSDFKYIDDIQIELLEGLYTLYVPDSLPWSHETTQETILDLMAALGIAKVDVAIMHGMFKHHIDIVNIKTFDDDWYLSIVKHYIIIGHNHSHKVYERIITPGSFSRMNFGEEENKGGIYIEVDEPNKDNRFIFLKNELATLFNTYDMRESTSLLEDTWEIVKKLPIGSHVRLLVDRVSTTSDIEKVVSTRLKDFRVVFKYDEEASIEEDLIIAKHAEVFSVTKETIRDLLLEDLEPNKILIEEIDSVV